MRLVLMAALAASTFIPAHASASIYVSATASTPVLIGNVVLGRRYRVTGSGVADLNHTFNTPQGLTFTMDGRPTYAFPSPVTAFYPNGLDYDPTRGTSGVGVGGSGKLYGSLMITYSTAPAGPSSYYALNPDGSFVATVTGPVYGFINDCAACYSDNYGGYNVDLNEGESTSYNYDALGRLIEVSHVGGSANGVVTQYHFDSAGNRTQIIVTGAP